MPSLFNLLIAYALLAGKIANAIPTISTKGNRFFTSEGSRFYIKGVAYQSDRTNYNGLTDGKQCAIDAKLIKDLGANVIRTYAVDPTLNHDDCMRAFEAQGIYVIVDMTTPLHAVDRNDPKWTIDLRNDLAKVIDGFQGYDNLMAFFAGSGVINDQSATEVAPYIKAIVADMKAYRDFMKYRTIPIGFSAADIAAVRPQMQDYFACGPANTSVDFYAHNKYSWCGESSMAESGYDTLYEEANNYNVPIFLSETGCNTGNNNRRTFDDQVAMLGREMYERYSGNIIYEWAQQESNYGLVSYSNDKASGTPSLLGDYTRLKSQWRPLNPTGIPASKYDPNLTRRPCPASTSSGWLVDKEASLPTLGTSGLSAPTGPRSTPSTSPTGTASGGEGTALAEDTSAQSDQEHRKKKKRPIGAIAGGILGGLIVIALLLGVILILLRRKRNQLSATEAQEAGAGAAQGPSDQEVVRNEQDKTQQNGFYGPDYHELHGQPATQELDPARGQIAPMPAPELASQRVPPEERTARDGVDRESAPVSGVVGEKTNAEPSPFVQRQRDMEMEWLESEEARLRERRELLRRQNGGDTT